MSEVPDRPAELPDVPEDIREAARIAPDHWFGMVDPTWKGEGHPPEWAVMGDWRSGKDGEIEEWRDNEKYRPSPQAMDWPDPTDGIDHAMQLAATGYGPVEDVLRLLAAAHVTVLLTPDGRPLSALTSDDLPVIPVFTSTDQVRTVGGFGSRTLSLADVLGQLPRGHGIYVNPTGPVGMVFEAQPLSEAIAAARVEASHATKPDEEGAVVDKQAATHANPLA